MGLGRVLSVAGRQGSDGAGLGMACEGSRE